MLTATTLFAISCPILIAFLGFVWLTGQAKIGVAFVLSYSLLSVVIVSHSVRAKPSAYYKIVDECAWCFF